MSAVTLASPGLDLSSGLARQGAHEDTRYRRLLASLGLHAALLAVLLVDLSYLDDRERVFSASGGTTVPFTLLVDVAGLTAPEAVDTVPPPAPPRQAADPSTLQTPPLAPPLPPLPLSPPREAVEPQVPPTATPEPLPPVAPPVEAIGAAPTAAPVPVHRPPPPPLPEPAGAQTADNPAAPAIQDPPVEATAQGSELPAAARAALGPPSRLAPGEEDAVRDALRPCWNVVSGARGDANLVVHVALRMNRDGTVVPGSVEVIAPTYPGDPVWASAANAAERAVRNPTCQPLPLPAERWPDWEYIEFTFDPRDMF